MDLEPENTKGYNTKGHMYPGFYVSWIFISIGEGGPEPILYGYKRGTKKGVTAIFLHILKYTKYL